MSCSTVDLELREGAERIDMARTSTEAPLSSVVPELLPCWCGAENWQHCFTGTRGGLARCAKCGCYQTDPPPLTRADQSEKFYTRYYAQPGKNGAASPVSRNSRSAGFWKVAEQFPALRQTGKRVVDVGCGDGHLCAELKYAGWAEVVGVDASATRTARARVNYPDISFCARSLSEAGLDNKSFDLAVMESVIEHLPQPLEQLKKLRACVRRDGRVVVTTPNMGSGHFRFLGRRWTGMLAPHAHIFLFTENSLNRALELAGFHVEASGNFQFGTYRLSRLITRFFSGDIKGATWRAHQELGTLYAHAIGQEAMLYAICRPR